MITCTLCLIFKRFSVKEHLIREISLKLVIVHLDENVVVPGFRLQSKRLMLANFISTSIECPRVDLHLLPFSTRAPLSLRVRSSSSHDLIFISDKCHLFEECFLFEMHLLSTDSQSHDSVLLLYDILWRLFYV
jgi:hypothetical protein